MSEIIIHRKSEGFAGFFGYKILLNGKKIASLSNGETKKLELKSGIYNLQAKSIGIDSQKLDFNISDEETKTFVVCSFRKGFLKNFLNIKKLKKQNL